MQHGEPFERCDPRLFMLADKLQRQYVYSFPNIEGIVLCRMELRAG